MSVATSVVGLVGAVALVAGAVDLGRALRAFAGPAGDGALLDVAERAILGVALVVAGTVLVYVALALGGVLPPW